MPGLTREQIESVDVSGLVDDVLAMPTHLEDALWRVESASLERVLGILGRPRPAAGLRHGGQCDRRRSRRSRAGRAAPAPAADGPRIRASRLGFPELRGAVRELLRQHRGDARVLRGRGGAGRDPDRGHDRRPPGRGGARGRRSGDPAAGRPAAAGGGRLHARIGAGGGGTLRRCAAPEDRDRRGRVLARRPGRELGARLGPGQPREAGRAARSQDLCLRLRGRADRGGRHALEDPDQREREGAGVLGASCRRPTTTRSSGGTAPRRWAASWRCSWRTPTSTRAYGSGWS